MASDSEDAPVITADQAVQTKQGLNTLPIIPAINDRQSIRPDACLPECSSKATLQVRCVLCTKWYHINCLKLTKAEYEGVWSCMRCRYVADEVAETRILTQTLLQQNSEMLDIIKRQQSQIDKFITMQTTTSGFLQDIKGDITDIKDEVLPDEEDESSDEDEDEEPEGTVCYGDSLIRDCVSTDADTEFVRAGPYIGNVKKIVKKLPKKKISKEMVFVIGTNDCQSKKQVNKIASDCEELVKEAVVRADSVIVSGIPPRDDNKVDPDKIRDVNDSYRQIALAYSDQNVKFVDLDDNFKYQGGKVDKSLLHPQDKLHLSHKGTQQLIDSLGLKAKPAIGNGPTQRWPSKDNNHNRHNSGEHYNHDTDSHKKLKMWPGVRNLPHLKKQQYFKSGNDPLSNFFMTQMLVFGKTFKSLEHAYQWRKGVYLGQHHIAWRIFNAPTASKAKKIADDELKTRGTEWYNMKKGIMYDLLTVKANQCVDFREALLKSGDSELIEDTRHEFWARGHDNNGLNMLGHLLMSIRSELRSNSTSNNPSHNHDNYRAPKNDYNHICFFCGEGNHSQHSCNHGRPLDCKHCSFSGHKEKHCPDLC